MLWGAVSGQPIYEDLSAAPGKLDPGISSKLPSIKAMPWGLLATPGTEACVGGASRP